MRMSFRLVWSLSDLTDLTLIMDAYMLVVTVVLMKYSTHQLAKHMSFSQITMLQQQNT